MYCQSCGLKNDDTSEFCVKCGRQLQGTPPRPSAGRSQKYPVMLKWWLLGPILVLLNLLLAVIWPPLTRFRYFPNPPRVN